ncbi:DUF1749-domain-containing protein [Lindgomyces ingoldianus]|uniref:DUF1749-domain-containing protein n=1 Tax=Lindgomyces ingoldianus TaxID=673940 RepID=A0ACB6QT60_9PLEO|nr:DUF1749-domain-containing protein [Lindgomyces ingoldianus]KAF2470070.1 DUF1749-domain-containing protein [Lindgomyces ingoldianus]
MNGILHRYTPRLVAFEHIPPNLSSNSNPSPATATPKNFILFIGGLGDGLLTISYPSTLAHHVPTDWTVVEVLTSSSYKGWGTGSLDRDVRELGRCVGYFRDVQAGTENGGKGGKIVLMGHSTGCQDIMAYLTSSSPSSSSSHPRPAIDGAILQGAVSDREGIKAAISPDTYSTIVTLARSYISQNKASDILPQNPLSKLFGASMTPTRALSLLSPDHDGDDDYFSSDLSEAQIAETFGRIPARTPAMFLLSGEDQFTPGFVDKAALLTRWTEMVRKGGGVVDSVNGGVVRGASHNLNGDGEDVVMDLVGRVVRFVNGLELGEIGKVGGGGRL